LYERQSEPDDKGLVDAVPWTIQQTFRGVLFTIIPWIAFALALSSLNRQSSTSTTPLAPSVDLTGAIVTFFFSVIIEGAFLIAPLYFANKAFRSITPHMRLALRALGFRGFSLGRALSWLVVLLLGIFAVNNLYQYVITVLHLNIQTNDQVLLAHSKEAPLTTYATLIAAVIVAPICEEVFFRGFVFTGLCRGMPVGWAIVLSALLFATTHADPGSFVVLFVIGLALAFLRWRTHSIWPGIALHALNNGAAALLIVLIMNGVVRG
jgi:membrane protease YdiL (CAAX protease family)